MKLGVNWTGARTSGTVAALAAGGKIDCVEIMIDNFLLCNPSSIDKVLGGVACSFHIMNSRFLTSEIGKLEEIAKQIRRLAVALTPMYVSDHIGLFADGRGRSYPGMMELDYSRASACEVAEKIRLWSSLLDCKLHVENYPSTLSCNYSQPKFFREVLDRCDARLLFDVSNSIVAEANTDTSSSDWFELLDRCEHVHVAGYSPTSFLPSFSVDDHTSPISDETLHTLNNIVRCGSISSICLECDQDRTLDVWLSEIRRVRDAVSDN